MFFIKIRMEIFDNLLLLVYLVRLVRFIVLKMTVDDGHDWRPVILIIILIITRWPDDATSGTRFTQTKAVGI